MRLFIGIKTKCNEHLTAMQNALRQFGRGNYTHPENLHITLKFLGEIPPAKIKAIREAMNEVAAKPLRMEICGAALFGKSGIAVAKVGGELAKLTALHDALDDALFRRGFAHDNRHYRPHITLARKYRSSSGADIGAIPHNKCSFTVDEIVLFESKRVEGRLKYEKVCGRMLG